MDRVKDEVAVITGSGGYLGSAIALTLAMEGADIVIWDIGEAMKDAKKVAEEIKGAGRKTVVMEVDVTNSLQVNQGVQRVIKELGKIDILVNNAGIVRAAPLITDLADEDWAAEIAVDLTGVFYCTRAVLEHMIGHRSGKIINISSMAGELGRPIASAAYSSAKAGVLGFTMSVAMSVAKYGICVNAITPGIILGPIHYRGFTEEQREKLLSGIPLVESGRTGTAKDIAYAVLFLASSESNYITGTRIRVNGGSLMG